MGMSCHDLVNARFAARPVSQLHTDFPHIAIMQYRICCMYNYSRKIVILVAIAFAAEMLSMLAIDFLYLRHIIIE